MTKAKKADMELVKTGPTDMATFDYGDNAGDGYQDQGMDDVSIPYIAVLQALSPQVAESTVDGAKAGMLFNTITEQLYPKEGVVFVPSLTEHVFVEWKPLAEGGGFVGVHQISSPEVAKAKAECEFGKYKTAAKNDLVETFYMYGVLLDENNEPGEFVTIAFASTKIKAYRKYNTRARMFTVTLPNGRKMNPPMYANTVRMTTVLQKNAKGSFYVPVLEPAVDNDMISSLLPPDSAAYKSAQSFRELVQSGTARVSHDGGAAAATTDGEAAPF